MAKSLKRQSTVERQIRKLQMRLTVVERALKPKRRSKPNNKIWEDYLRRKARLDERSKVMREYYDAERERRLRENPDQLRIALEEERKENAFLKSRGMKPNPSMIPQALRPNARGRLPR